MDIFSALADPTRRHIIEQIHLCGPQSIKQLGDELSISRQALTKHLNKLIQAKLISAEFIGKERIHSLNDKPLQQLKQWLAPFEAEWDVRLSALTDHLGESDE